MATISLVFLSLQTRTSPKAPLPMILRGSKSLTEILTRLKTLHFQSDPSWNQLKISMLSISLTIDDRVLPPYARSLVWLIPSPAHSSLVNPSWSSTYPMLPSSRFLQSAYGNILTQYRPWHPQHVPLYYSLARSTTSEPRVVVRSATGHSIGLFAFTTTIVTAAAITASFWVAAITPSQLLVDLHSYSVTSASVGFADSCCETISPCLQVVSWAMHCLL